mmetsp:Transcript_30438/g.76440  ORF Transcript_30438/g.76440 Transcript_30438/m.76440 type:complete len:96 (-) Transcript_30438:12-299(-)|eukprot:CAMPEP_0177653662 /NCGR_PEP_ID=MMETSP0447-20121125/13869_1 /TAXON_ID=0 /ORGANISM="Stygamoeba regulata, Strain BSH-02190019" /LENGTH=95 /DNA_ID=CAMNT_0019157161 /DNA_START=47 /DNA_END=334 /DNA_ORIENTATION=-
MSSQSQKCPGCNKTVYFAEKVVGLNKWWHKPCFKCTKCSKTLQPAQFSDHEDKPYCKRCYDNSFRHQGYGFGQSGGLDCFPELGAEGEIIGGDPK